MTNEETQAELERLRAENERLKAIAAAKIRKSAIRLAVAPKTGCLMILGLNRFPVCLYKEQAETILGMDKEIRAFIQAHPELKERE